jgi:hypothetical protein
MRRIAHIIVVLGSIAAASCGGPAQSGSAAPSLTPPTTLPPRSPVSTYTLSGTVREAWIDTGLPGATVSIATGPSRGSTVTNEQGRYTLTDLLPGVYSVTFSRPAPYGAITYSPVNVFADTAFSGGLSLSSGLPTTASLQGYWVAQGPYPNEPCWIVIFQNGKLLQGWYRDQRDYSTSMSGTYDGDAVFIRVGTSGLTIEGHVEDARCIRAVIKNEALGGNFPVAISRGGDCSR